MDRDPRSRSATSTGSGGRRRSSVHAGSRRRSIRLPTSTTSTRASLRPASHKPNTAVAQAYYNKAEGVESLATETGRGSVGVSARAWRARSSASQCDVYMVKVSYQQKPYRRSLMQAFGATVTRQPVRTRRMPGVLVSRQDPDSPGSLGLAIAEAVEVAATSGGRTKYSLGSVLNHVLMHQTVIGTRGARAAGDGGRVPGRGRRLRRRWAPTSPGFVLPVRAEQPHGEEEHPRRRRRAGCGPSLTKGKYVYDFGDTAMTDAARQDAHAWAFVHSGSGPRGRAALPRDGADRLRALRPGSDRGGRGAAEPGLRGGASRSRGRRRIIPAPEAAHAIRGAIDEALHCKETGEEKVIAFNLCGHGHFDMAAYDDYLAEQAHRLRVLRRGRRARHGRAAGIGKAPPAPRSGRSGREVQPAKPAYPAKAPRLQSAKPVSPTRAVDRLLAAVQWQVPEPASVNDSPAAGRNCQS